MWGVVEIDLSNGSVSDITATYTVEQALDLAWAKFLEVCEIAVDKADLRERLQDFHYLVYDDWRIEVVPINLELKL